MPCTVMHGALCPIHPLLVLPSGGGFDQTNIDRELVLPGNQPCAPSGDQGLVFCPISDLQRLRFIVSLKGDGDEIIDETFSTTKVDHSMSAPASNPIAFVLTITR